MLGKKMYSNPYVNKVAFKKTVDAKQNREIAKLKKAVKNEIQYVNSSISGALAIAGAVQVMNGVAEGDDVGQRSGRELQAKEFSWRATLNNTAGVQTYSRFIIFIWKAPTVPIVTSVLATANYLAPYNLDNQKFYRVLTDKTFTFGRDYAAGLTTSGDRVNKTVIGRRKLNLKNKYNGINAADIVYGQIYVLTIGTAVTNFIDSQYQFKFTD